MRGLIKFLSGGSCGYGGLSLSILWVDHHAASMSQTASETQKFTLQPEESRNDNCGSIEAHTARDVEIRVHDVNARRLGMKGGRRGISQYATTIRRHE